MHRDRSDKKNVSNITFFQQCPRGNFTNYDKCILASFSLRKANVNIDVLYISEPIIPCLYFEAELKHAPCRVKQIGFINVETREKLYCDIHDGHLQLPKSSSASPYEQESFRIPDVVGCAVIVSTGQVMFTLDGVSTGQFYDFPTNKPSPILIENLFPYISCTRIRCNYGQRSFLFEDANSKESFLWTSSLLQGCLPSKAHNC